MTAFCHLTWFPVPLVQVTMPVTKDMFLSNLLIFHSFILWTSLIAHAVQVYDWLTTFTYLHRTKAYRKLPQAKYTIRLSAVPGDCRKCRGKLNSSSFLPVVQTSSGGTGRSRSLIKICACGTGSVADRRWHSDITGSLTAVTAIWEPGFTYN